MLGLRRAEDAKSTKLKRYEMVDLGRNDKRMADLLRRADECALKLLNESPEVVEMFMATYRLEEVSKAARADDHSDEV